MQLIVYTEQFSKHNNKTRDQASKRQQFCPLRNLKSLKEFWMNFAYAYIVRDIDADLTNNFHWQLEPIISYN